jgi:hypothetical protein
VAVGSFGVENAWPSYAVDVSAFVAVVVAAAVAKMLNLGRILTNCDIPAGQDRSLDDGVDEGEELVDAGNLVEKKHN